MAVRSGGGRTSTPTRSDDVLRMVDRYLEEKIGVGRKGQTGTCHLGDFRGGRLSWTCWIAAACADNMETKSQPRNMHEAFQPEISCMQIKARLGQSLSAAVLISCRATQGCRCVVVACFRQEDPNVEVHLYHSCKTNESCVLMCFRRVPCSHVSHPFLQKCRHDMAGDGRNR